MKPTVRMSRRGDAEFPLVLRKARTSELEMNSTLSRALARAWQRMFTAN
jgi:hypothetical protein